MYIIFDVLSGALLMDVLIWGNPFGQRKTVESELARTMGIRLSN